MLNLIWSKPLISKPGSELRYSYANYILLGLIIEHITKKKYSDFIQKELFDKVSMPNTGFGKAESEVTGYYITEEEKLIPAYSSNEFKKVTSAADAFSNADDLHKYMRSMFDGKLLSKKSLQKMLTTHNRKKNGQAFGFNKHKFFLFSMYYNASRFEGYSSFILYFPFFDLTMILLSNTYADMDFCITLLKALKGMKSKIPKSKTK